MAFTSLKSVFARAALASPDQVDSWSRAWRLATDNGSLEPRLTFFAREADGMVWTEIPISGNGSDLTRKAAEAITAAHNAEDP